MSKTYEANIPQAEEIQAKIEATFNDNENINYFELDEDDIAYDYDYLVSFKNEQSIHETYEQIKKEIPEIKVKILPDQIEDLVKDNEELVVDFYFDIKENMEGEKMENIEQEIKALQAMNQEVMKLQTVYCDKKSSQKELEAQLYLYGEEQVKEALGKEKPSQKDKEYFAQLQTLKLQKEVETAYLEYKYSQENYKLKKMEFRAKYPTVEI